MMEAITNSKENINTSKRNQTLFNEIPSDVNGFSCPCNCKNLLADELILRWRLKYHTLKRGREQQLKLLELYRETLVENRGIRKSRHVIEGNTICSEAWFKVVMKISYHTYMRTRDKAHNGLFFILKSKTSPTRAVKGVIAKGFMENYVNIMGDRSPTDPKRILLPVGITRKHVFEEYCQTHSNHLQKTHFYRLWANNFKHVTHPKHCRMSKCNVCMLAKTVLQHQLPPATRDAITKDWNEHLLRQQNERKEYYKRRADAMANPTQKLSVIVDGMDQAKTNLPHFEGWQLPKACKAADLLKTHIVGALIHGRATYLFIDIGQYPHDTNLTLTCLLWSLERNLNGKPMPEILFIQLDNCSRENKNRYFLGMMAYLVKAGYTKQVYMSFLMVGHTHEDVDQRFSLVSKRLRRNSAKDLEELVSVAQQSSKDCIVEVMSTVWNMRDWLEPFLNPIHNHSYPHIYWIYGEMSGHVAIKYKNWSAEEEWLPKATEEPISIFKIENGKQTIPNGTPHTVVPDFVNANIDGVKGNIERMRQFLTSKQYAWWADLIANPERTMSRRQDFPLLDVQKYRDVAPTPMNIGSELGSPLAPLMEKERNVPKVYSGKRRSLKAPQRVAPVPETQAISPAIGYLVVFEHDGCMRVGMVKKINLESALVSLFTGSLGGMWSPKILPNGNPCQLIINRASIAEEGIFVLNKNGHLPSYIKQMMRSFPQW